MKNFISYILPLKWKYGIYHWWKKEYYNSIRNSPGDYSLIGFENCKCIFVHIPKAGGISINKTLFNNYGGGHKTIRDYKKIYGLKTFYSFYKFTFVRNPFSRLVSAYTFLRKGGFHEQDLNWAKENLFEYNTFSEFVRNWLNEENIWKYHHFKPQYYFLCEDEKSPIEVDFVGRIENIEQDFERICKKIGISKKLEHYNKTKKENSYSAYYNNELKKKVVDVYKRDFELLGYDIDWV